MNYETLITKMCPLIRDTCKGEGCAAYHGNAEAGSCFLFDQDVGAPAPVAAAPAPAAE